MIKKILNNLPDGPGVYRMIDKYDEIIYIGKAKNLKKRVRSYFRKSKQHTRRIIKMVSHVVNITYVEVKSELEALILETNLIKEYRPRYNILMRDDKSHVYLKVTLQEDFPRIYKVRNPVADGSKYFGPYTGTDPITQMHRLFKRMFPYRSCHLDIHELSPGNVTVKPRMFRLPCLEYYIKRCTAPCVGKINKKDYKQTIDEVVNFLSGKTDRVFDRLDTRMKDLAKKKRFEQAAVLRDQIASLQRLTEGQDVSSTKFENLDVVAFTRGFNKICVNLFQVRFGKIKAQFNFLLQESVAGASDDEVLESFITQHYPRTSDLPKTILVASKLENSAILEKWLETTLKLKKTIKIVYPQRGEKKRMVELSRKNADSYLEQTKVRWMTEKAKTTGAAKALAENLGINHELKRIECYDISHMSGTNKVGAMIVFVDGTPDKQQYRKFQVKSLAEGVNDDYAALAEVLYRRLKKLQREISEQKIANAKMKKIEDLHTKTKTGKSLKSSRRKKIKEDTFIQMPDLIIIDGGKGQLSTVVNVINSLGLENKISVCSLAKREEEIFLPHKKEPVELGYNTEELFLVQRIRDETHRYAISYHRDKRSRGMIKSALDDVRGLGPKKKKLLLQEFGSLKGIKKAGLMRVSKLVGEKLATMIIEKI